MSDSPLLSVIIPVYNTERYLSRCLDSIINQDYKNLEIICVNDGSNDSSYNILLKYSEIDSRIKIINKKNEGAAIARNTALNIAAGTYITFVDSDDEIKENTYNTLLKYFSDDIDIVCFGTEEHTGDSISSPIKSSSYFFIERTSTEYITDNFIFSISKTIWNKIFRRDIIFKNNIIFPPYKAFEDNSFVVKYLLHIKKLIWLKKNFIYII